MSFFFAPRPNPRPAPSVVESDLLAAPSAVSLETTTNALSTLDEVVEHEWVLFSPQASVSSQYDVLSQPSAALAPNDDVDDDDVIAHLNTPDESGDLLNRQLELPGHNGSGSFVIQAQERRDLMERVNQWRLDQSHLVFSELQRLENKFFPVYSSDKVDDNATPEPRPSPSPLWSRITRRVMANIDSIFSLDDEVLDILFSDKLSENLPPSNLPQPNPLPTSHFARARLHGPYDWNEKIIDRLFEELGMKRGPQLSLLRRLLTWGLPEPHHINGEFRHRAGPSFEAAPDYFWDDFDSSSVASTPVY